VNNINDKRAVYYASAKEWVNDFIKQNKKLKENNINLYSLQLQLWKPKLLNIFIILFYFNII
jgi:hypothetical protein